MTRGHVCLLDGRPLEAVDAFRAIRSLLDPPPTHVAVPAALWEADAWLALGEPERSRAALDVPELDGVPDVWLARARLELAQGEPEAALASLRSFKSSEADQFMPYAGCQALALEALARDALRDEAGALDALERCLDLVEPRGNGGVLLSFGASLRSLLRRAIAGGTSHRSLADDLLALLDGESTPTTGRLSRCSTRSASGSWRSSASSRRCSRTRRSPPRCSSRPTPSRPTSSTSTASSTWRTAGRRCAARVSCACSAPVYGRASPHDAAETEVHVDVSTASAWRAAGR